MSLKVFSPAQILFIVQATAIRHSVFFFLFLFYISSFWNLEICSYLFILFFPVFLLSFSTLLSIPCSVFSLCLSTLFSDLPYCFLFKSAILSFLSSYYSILSASPLCSITIQSALFLLFFSFLDPYI